MHRSFKSVLSCSSSLLQQSLCKSQSNQTRSLFSKSIHTSSFFNSTIRPLATPSYKRFFASAASEEQKLSGEDLFSKAMKDLKEIEKQGKLKIEVDEVAKTHRKNRRMRAADEAWGTAKDLPGSVKKTKLVANLIKGLTYENAVIQLKLCDKRLAVYFLKTLQLVRYNATNNHNLKAENLIVSEILIGRHHILKKGFPRARGKTTFREKRTSRILMILKELHTKDHRLQPKSQNKRMYYQRKSAEEEEKKDSELKEDHVEKEHSATQ